MTETGTQIIGLLNTAAQLEYDEVDQIVALATRLRGPQFVLPTAPGTTIAVGDWWLTLLPPLVGATVVDAGAWELLAPRDEATKTAMTSLGVRWCQLYSAEWVMAQVEQAGGFTVIAAPAAG